MTDVRAVPLDAIRADASAQPRVAMLTDEVAGYVERMAEHLPALVDCAAAALKNARSSADIRNVDEFAAAIVKVASALEAYDAASGALRISARASALLWRIHKGREPIPAKRKRAVASEMRGCFLCGRSDEPIEIDHLRPVCLGGDNTSDNLIAICRTCNRRKGKSSLSEFLLRERSRRRREADEYILEASRLDALYHAITKSSFQPKGRAS